MSTANNYVPALRGFASGGPFGYRAADVADFNSLSENGCFAAFVTCIIRGSYQSNGVPDPQFLWGTRDPGTPNNGWSITIEAAAGQGAIVGRVGIGAGVGTVTYTITGGGTPAFVERVMQIALFLTEDPALILVVNGSVVAVSGVLGTPFAPSAFPVSLGISPVTPVAEAAPEVDICAAGYTYNVNFPDTPTVGDFAGRSFQAEREALTGGSFDPNNGTDWVHRYDVRTLALNQYGSITKFPTSAKLRTDALPNPFGYPPGPATWPDSGNVLVPGDDVAAITYSPIALQRIGPLLQGSPTQPIIVGRKNPLWYSGGSFEFPAA